MSQSIKLLPFSAFSQGLMLAIVKPIISAIVKITNEAGFAILFINLIAYLVIKIRWEKL